MVMTLDHLTSLELHCTDEVLYAQYHKRTNALIQCIHDAPSLEKLAFADRAAVHIADIEKLHAAATKLKHMELMNVGIPVGEVDQKY